MEATFDIDEIAKLIVESTFEGDIRIPPNTDLTITGTLHFDGDWETSLIYGDDPVTLNNIELTGTIETSTWTSGKFQSIFLVNGTALLSNNTKRPPSFGLPVHPNHGKHKPKMLFQLDNITKTYGSITALRQLSAEVPMGAIGLLGPNGAGKTTLIRTLLGLITIDHGAGQVLGMDFRARQLDIRQAVGFMPEDECLFPGVPGVEFASYAGELCGMGRDDAMQRAHEVLNYVGLGEARYRSVVTYSTGMKQRLKLAAAVMHDPKLLILDEPTNGMDPRGRQEMLELAHDLTHQKDMSVLFSSHLLPDVEFVCDHVLVLSRGTLLAQGKIQELKQIHQNSYEVRVKHAPQQFANRLDQVGCTTSFREDVLIVELPAGEDQDMLWRCAKDSSEQIRYLRPRRSSLEEVFLQAVESES